jgi:acetyltransferase-like isoleucine patch superfamily enzyme
MFATTSTDAQASGYDCIGSVSFVASSQNSSGRFSRLAFSVFSYIDHLVFQVLNVMPPVARWAYYKLLCRRFGRRVLLDYDTYIRYPHKVSIGNDVAINRGCRIYPSLLNKEATITLEDGVVLGPQVTFFGAGQNPRSENLADVAASIVVGRRAYIGGNSTIRYGVKIGEGAVVAAGSVVVDDVAAYTVVGGVPAKVISQRTID